MTQAAHLFLKGKVGKFVINLSPHPPCVPSTASTRIDIRAWAMVVHASEVVLLFGYIEGYISFT